MVRILMECNILNMLYHLDLSLLEVLFIYTTKMSEKEIFSLSAHVPSLQLVFGLLDSTKGTIKGHVVSGPWASSYEHLAHIFEPRRSLGIMGRSKCSSLVFSFITMRLLLMFSIWCITGNKRRWQLVKWVDKASFDQLNKLFVISASERNHQTLLIDKNLKYVVHASQLYITPTISCFAPRVLVPREHYVLKNLSFYEEARATNAKARQDRLG